MTDSTALTRLNIDEMARVSKALAESQRFGRIQPQEAFVSVLAGQEIGVPPFASITGINVIQGKPVIGSGILAGLVKASVKYDYRVTQHDNERCVIAFFEHGDHIGDSTFTIEDAKRAGLIRTGSAWVTFPKNMVFARALSNGVAFFCPDVTMGRVYVEGEIEESLPTPPPAPRDVVAVVEAEQAPPASTPSTEPAAPTLDLADVKAMLAGLSQDEQKAMANALKAAGVKSGGGLARAIVANLDAFQWAEWLAQIDRDRVERFPDDLVDVQNAQPERERPSAVERQAVTDAKADDETEAMFGEAMQSVGAIPTYGEGAPS